MFLCAYFPAGRGYPKISLLSFYSYAWNRSVSSFILPTPGGFPSPVGSLSGLFQLDTGKQRRPWQGEEKLRGVRIFRDNNLRREYIEVTRSTNSTGFSKVLRVKLAFLRSWRLEQKTMWT